MNFERDQNKAFKLPTTMNTAALSLPVVSVQNTFPHVIQEVEDGLIPYDKFWVSCYKNSEPSIHAKVKAELDDLNRNLVRLNPIEGDVDISRDDTGVSAISSCWSRDLIGG